MKKLKNRTRLHFILYNRGYAGMCNILLSVQNALIIARLTDRTDIVFYCDADLFNSQKHLNIFDLYNVKYDFSIKPVSEYPEYLETLPDFSDCCFYKCDQPSAPFANGRRSLDLESFSALENIGSTEVTLGYYAYLFFLKTALKDEIVEFVKKSITPKQKYLDEALKIAQKYSSYQSIHIRRGDYLSVPGTRNEAVTWDEMLPNISSQFDKNIPVLIHTDEADEAYFQPLVEAGYQLCFFEKELNSDFDDTEKGLISILVATQATLFMGTMISTFTGIIQQYRRQHGDYTVFKYLYSQVESLKISAGEIVCKSIGVYTWNRLDISDNFKKILFFLMEYPESYPDKDFKTEHAMKVYPDFLDAAEISHFVELSKSEKSDYDARQNRDRFILNLSEDKILSRIAKRFTKLLGNNDHSFESSVQMFRQKEGGETFLHNDVLQGEKGAKRLMSVLLYLTDGYEGGNLNFPYLKSNISPAKGTMIYFPIINKYGEHVLDFAHSASVITRGSKLMCYLTLNRKSKAKAI